MGLAGREFRGGLKPVAIILLLTLNSLSQAQLEAGDRGEIPCFRGFRLRWLHGMLGNWGEMTGSPPKFERAVILLAALVVIFLAGCGREKDPWRESSLGVNAYVGRPEGVSGYFSTDHNCYYLQEPVVARAWLENHSREVATLRSSDYPVVSLWLCPAFSDGLGCTMLESEKAPVHEIVLEPGERYEIEGTVRGPTKDAAYEILVAYSVGGSTSYNRGLIYRYPECGGFRQ